MAGAGFEAEAGAAEAAGDKAAAGDIARAAGAGKLGWHRQMDAIDASTFAQFAGGGRYLICWGLTPVMVRGDDSYIFCNCIV